VTVTVSFVTAGGANSSAGIGIKRVRAKEVVTVPGTTTTTALDGEMILIGNGEASMVAVAFGTTPDAAATSESLSGSSLVSSAGFPVGAGQVGDPIIGVAGAKVNIKAA